jgi:hypothetical protein
MFIFRVFIFGLLILSLAAEPTTAPADHGVGTIEMRIIGPDDDPVAHTIVHLAADVSPTPADHGVARFQWKLGKARMNVDVPGVGYGMTGITIVTRGVMPRTRGKKIPEADGCKRHPASRRHPSNSPA